MFDPKRRRRINGYYYYDAEEELQRKGIKIAVYLIIIGVCIITILGIANTIGIFIPLITALVYKGRSKRFQWQHTYGKFKYVLIAAIVITAIELFFLSQIHPVLVSSLDGSFQGELKVPKGVNISLFKSLVTAYFLQQQIGTPNLVVGGLFILAFTKNTKDLSKN